MLLSLLWLVCSLPLFTFIASSAALSQCAGKLISGEESGVFKCFFKAFRENLKRGAQFSLLYILCGAAELGAYMAAGILSSSGFGWIDAFRAVYIVFAAVLLLTMPWVSSYIARFNNTFSGTCGVAFYFTVRHILSSVIMAVSLAAAAVAAVFFPPALVAIPALLALAFGRLTGKAFGKFLKEQNAEQSAKSEKSEKSEMEEEQK